MKQIITLIFIICSMQSYTYGTNYYISNAGNDNNDGASASTPWQTLDKANATTFQPGDTLFLHSGDTWLGSLLPKGSGVEGSPIVITKYGGITLPIINASSSTNKSAGLNLNYQSYWEIFNLEITNTQGTASTDTMQLFGIYIAASYSTPGISHIYIQNCYIHDVNSVSSESHSNFNKATGGIMFSGYTNDILVKGCRVINCKVTGIRNNSNLYCSHIVIDSNYIENIYGDGIVYHGATNNSSITRNIVKNCCYNTNSANYAGIWTYSSRGTTVAYNEVSGLKGGGSNDGQPFDADNDTDGDIFEYNYSHDNKKGFMLFMPSSSNIIVRYNLSIRDNGVANNYQGRRLFNYTSDNSSNKIYNNVFYIDTAVDVFFQTKFNALFANNIVYSTSSITNFTAGTPQSSAQFLNNCFYPASIITNNGPSAGGTASGNITSNPLFVNAGGTSSIGRLNGEQTKYNLQPSSLCITNGTYIPDNDNIYDYIGANAQGRMFIGAILPSNAPYYTYNQTINKKLDSAIAVADASGDVTAPTTNNGSSASLYIKAGGPNTAGYVRRAFFRFPTAQLHTDRLSDTAIHVKVRLKAYGKDGVYTTNGLSLWTISNNSWVESTLTYNNMPSLVDSIVGVLNSGKSVSSSSTESIDFDITNYIKNYITINGTLPSYLNFGVRGFSTIPSGTATGNSGVSVYTKENVVSDTLSPSIIMIENKDTAYTLQESTTPVQASLLSIKNFRGSILLNWNTYSESNSNYFRIERSIDGKTFIPIGEVTAAGTSNATLSYSYTDVNPLNGVSYYRWTQYDLDGQFQRSNVVSIDLSETHTIKIYPNPIKVGQDIQVESSDNKATFAQLIDAQGRSISTTKFANKTSISTKGLSAGIYFLQIGRKSYKVVLN